MLSVNRPIDVVVLNCCVTATKDTPLRSKTRPALRSPAGCAWAVDLVDDHGIDLPVFDVDHQAAQGWTFHVAARVAAIVVSVADAIQPVPLAGKIKAKPASRWLRGCGIPDPAFVGGFAGGDGAALLWRDCGNLVLTR